MRSPARAAIELHGPALSRPPAMTTIGAAKARSAVRIESTLVALLSFQKRMPPTVPAASMRCSRPGNAASSAASAAGGASQGSVAATAHSAFMTLCGPGTRSARAGRSTSLCFSRTRTTSPAPSTNAPSKPASSLRSAART